MDLDNQIAIVTGGASGMGKACVEMLSQHGVRVAVWDKEFFETKYASYSLVCDVTSEEAISDALEKTIQQLGTPSICINCAGIAPAQKMIGKDGVMPLGRFKQVIEVNLIGTFNVMRLVAAAMMQREILAGMDERGVIINTASIAAYEGQIGQTAYSASKGGIVSMTLPAARELAAYGIRVNTIAPGLIATPLLLNMPSEVQNALAAQVPFPKRFGKPEEFASLVMHIIENSMINGETIRLDGALRMQPR